MMKSHAVPAGSRRKKASLRLGLAAGVLARLFPRRAPQVSCRDLKALDIPWSMQRVGVRFTERIRDVFRFRWIRKLG